jgi:hypothetical protein
MTAAILAPHPGTRCKPRPHRRLLARLRTRRQRRQVEDARDDAYVVRIEAHAVPPMAQAQAAVTATIAAVTDAFNVPPAAVLPDEITAADDHLRPDQYGDDTHAFSRYVDGGQE